MKNLITIFIMVVAVGCDKTETKTEVENRQLTAEEEKVVGTYEFMNDDEQIGYLVFLKIRVLEIYVTIKYMNDVREWKGGSWKIVGNEVHTDADEFYSNDFFKIEPNGDSTRIADIRDGKRIEVPKCRQRSLKKLNTVEAAAKKLECEEELENFDLAQKYKKKLAGTYERKNGGDSEKYVFVKSGSVGFYKNGESINTNGGTPPTI